MQTIYDWVTVAVFAALAILLVRRAAAGAEMNHLWQYLAAAAGCGVIDWLGNSGYHLAAIACGVFLLLYIWIVLRPLDGLR
jgi:hypothetical protein